MKPAVCRPAYTIPWRADGRSCNPTLFFRAREARRDGTSNVAVRSGFPTDLRAGSDGVELLAAVRRSAAFRPYLMYQLLTARENDADRAGGEPALHAMTFAEFAGLGPDVIGPV